MSRLHLLISTFALLTLSCLVVSLASPQTASAQTTATETSVVKLTVDPEVHVGEAMVVEFSGPSAGREFISVDPAGAIDAKYGKYVYADRGSPATLRAPDEPGSYEVRYHSGATGYSVLGKVTLTVIDSSAEIVAPSSVDAGAEVEFTWTGPETDKDFISIDQAGAGDRAYGKYAYTSSGSPMRLHAPDEAGSYEIRYHLGQSYRVIGRTPLEVGGVGATIEAVPTVSAGSEIVVTWTGPSRSRDYISIDEAGSSEREYGVYAYTEVGSPLTVRAPDVPGAYEIRYHMGQSRKVIASSRLTVTANSATVTPPASAEAGLAFEVEWTGPDQHLDFITVVPVGTAERNYGNYAYTKRGTPLLLEAPKEPGMYEVRYATGQKYLTLASAPIEIVPGTAPGMLRVIADDTAAVTPAIGALELILDASGSMLQKLDGKRRIDLAKDALTRLTRNVPAGVPFALRVFGHEQADACRTDLEIPLAPLDADAAVARIGAIEAKNLAKTPIADSLRAVAHDLAGSQPPRIIVLVTDGEETCDGDPAAAIEALRAAGFDVRVNVVGFAIDELMLKREFESWARLGGGHYFDAADGASLSAAMEQSLRVPFEILDGQTVIATGVVGGDRIAVPPGSYSVRIASSPELVIESVEVVSGTEVDVRME